MWYCRGLCDIAVDCVVLSWAVWYCRGLCGIAVDCVVLLWTVWYCRGLCVITVDCVVLPWTVWYYRGLCGIAVDCVVLPWTVWYCGETHQTLFITSHQNTLKGQVKCTWSQKARCHVQGCVYNYKPHENQPITFILELLKPYIS